MRTRIAEVDVLRGFALFGISIVNTVGITGMPVDGRSGGAAYWAYETLLHQRFFPIFSFLFGVGFGLFLEAAGEKVCRPRVAMLARLGFLVPFGALHRLLQPDEVLLSYAVVGIVVLLPASFLPGRAVLALGAVVTVAAVLVTGGGSVLIPGLFLLGYAAQRHGIEKLLGLSGRCLAAVFGVGLLLAVVLNVWQVGNGSGSGTRLAAVAGLATAATYVVLILLLLRSRARGALEVLAPLGRMALTGYIGATLMIVLADHFADLGKDPAYGMAVSLGICVFLVELAFSSLWLRYAWYGPLEWVWRCLTWWDVVPIRRRRGRAAVEGG
ncbi:DUF418 domain-containing protein [Actinomadura soli]|uniref:DUF418 domain-containing protein n=1 Tax=Actinomadura soli TaxID=2508997 RepID=A0A5C4J1A4_9ACTN|nr:DUF418 domain-containing protein [Actinomadura soli]TMQ90474.1 DUF418 domain-containing protein [Actinomadura soli]